LAGLATPTGAAGIGAAGALVLSIAYGRLTWDGLQRAMLATMAT
jgi:TRAP-type mannitol/chloroaromatic compound transport system permease large subunit